MKQKKKDTKTKEPAQTLMRRMRFLQATTIGVLCSGGNGGLNAMASENRAPNILFILADDLGWMDVGCYGSDFYETPNLDRLAEQGMRFTNACTRNRFVHLPGRQL